MPTAMSVQMTFSCACQMSALLSTVNKTFIAFPHFFGSSATAEAADDRMDDTRFRAVELTTMYSRPWGLLNTMPAQLPDVHRYLDSTLSPPSEFISNLSRVDNTAKCQRQRADTTQPRRVAVDLENKERRQKNSFPSIYEAPLSDQTDIRKLLFFHNNESKPFPSSPFVIGLIIKRPVDVPL